MKLQKCEQCYWYRWEDSVWGYCWRFPPAIIIKQIFPRIRYKQTRPEVYYSDIVCGEYIHKYSNQIKRK